MSNVGENGELCAVCRKKWMMVGRADWKNAIYGCKKKMECIMCDSDSSPRCRDPNEKRSERSDCKKMVQLDNIGY